MVKSKAMTGFGSKFSMAATLLALPNAESEWAEVIAMKLPSDSWDTAEVTHFGSANRRREHIKTLIDGGEADIQVNLIPGSVTDLAAAEAAASSEAYFYQFLIPSGVGTFWKVSGDCLAITYDRETPLEDRMTATISVKFTGDRTEAAAA
jgi:hypothetical protein